MCMPATHPTFTAKQYAAFMKVTLITGASGGIGEALARRLAAEKHHLLLVARSENKLRQLCDELTRTHNITAQYVATDLATASGRQQLFEETEKRRLEVDWLINNAGIGSAGDFSKLPLDSELDMISLNVSALAALTHHYLQKMRARNSGTIINVASMACFMPVPFMAAYAATKAFVRSFTGALQEENRPYNIQIMLLCPGATDTNFFEAAKIGEENKSAFLVMGIETPAQVAATAVSGIRRSKSVAISGFKNRVVARLGKLIPTSVIIRSFAKQHRPLYE